LECDICAIVGDKPNDVFGNVFDLVEFRVFVAASFIHGTTHIGHDMDGFGRAGWFDGGQADFVDAGPLGTICGGV